MKFGVSVGDAPASKGVEVVEHAEALGFDQAWVWDSHILWTECFSLMGFLAARTSRIEFGTCVTNPQTRDPTVLASAFATLAGLLAGRRAICGIGKGDSAVRLMKRGPSRLAYLEHAIDVVRELGSGRPLDLDGVELKIDWAGPEIPIYLAAYGPNALRLAGRKADGVILQIGDPYFIAWAKERIREGAEEAGRDPAEVTIHCAVVSCPSDDLDYAREQCRWFGAMVGNHIADSLKYHDPDALPAAVREYVERRSHYDYRHHTEPGADHAEYVPDEIVDRFCLIGDVGAVRAKLAELRDLGVGELNLYPHVDDFPGVMETFAREIAPGFRTPAPA